MKTTDEMLLESHRKRALEARRGGGLPGNVALVIGALFVGALLCEIALRAILPAPITWEYPQESYEYDDEIGHKLRANQSTFTHDKLVTTNTLGLRDADYSPVPPAGVTRVLALGDSQTFGNGLALAETWPKQLEQLLNSKNPHWQVINAGLPASDTWQHQIIFDRLSRAYNPQIAVLAVYVNDVTKRHRASKQHTESMTNTFEKRVGYMLKQSALVLVLRQAYANISQRSEPDSNASNEKSILDGSYNLEVERAWKEVEQSMTAMKKRAQERNIKLVAVVLPRKDQVDGTEPGLAYNRRIHAIAGSLGIPVLDVLPDLKRAYQDEGPGLFIPWDGHNSAKANKVIATRVAQRFGHAPGAASR